MAAQSDCEEQPANRPRQARHPRLEKFLDRLGEGEIAVRCGQPLLGKRSPQFQREQRVAQRGVEDPPQQVPRQGQAEPLAQHVAHRVEAQRPHAQALEIGSERPLELSRRAGAPGEQEPHTLAGQAPRGEGDRVRGGAIEPLDVVDRDEHRLVRGERAQGPENAGGDGARLGRRGVSLDA